MKVSSIKKGKLLVEKGLSPKTVSKLTESEIDTIYSTLMNEQVTQTSKMVKTTKIPASTAKTVGSVVDGISIKQDAAGNIIATQTEQELDEDDMEDPMDFEKGERSQDPHQVGPSSDDGFDEYGDGMGMFEEKKKKKINPWAICTAQLADEFGTSERSEWTKGQMAKYERCVQDVKSKNKKSLKEGKDSLTLFLENELIKLVEKHLPPKITKKELMNYLSEAPAVAPAKPKTKPDVKPGTKPRPASPGKNPFPGEHPAPKAGLPPDEAKKEVIDLIMNLIKKS